MFAGVSKTWNICICSWALIEQYTCRFGAYNVGGALLWTIMFVGAGFFLGNLPAVKHNFTLVVLGIVAVSP